MLEHLHPYLIAGILFLFSLAASSISIRNKIPPLLLFLVIGMLAGGEGIGGLVFNDATLANHVGSLALAFILFSGGFDTKWKDVKPIIVPGVTLATLGVFITAVMLAVCIWRLFGLPLLESFLISAIVSSTDAAAVFSVLRTQQCGLKGDLAPLLEFESASNDPMAIFLTTVTLGIITNPDTPIGMMFVSFLVQMAMGGVCGWALGKMACLLVEKLQMENEALYPVFGIGIVFTTFGISATLGGNGYLAVYVCGIMMGNGDYIYKRSLAKFHDGFAWLMQIGMFLILGLLVNPSEVRGVAAQGLALSFLLMFIVRPAMVFICDPRGKFSIREKLFIGWAGLRGAVPIILATYPFQQNYANARYIFNLIFFVVIASVLIQGKTLALVSKWLRLDSPLRKTPRYPLEFTKTHQTDDEETREIDIQADSAAIGKKVVDLGFPKEVTILLIHRGNKFLIPKGDTVVAAEDMLLIFGTRKKLHDVEESLSERVVV